MRRKIYWVPNFLTTLNLFFGFYSIVVLMQSRYLASAYSIMVAGLFDLMDGRVARLTHATSRFGIEYDSLSDLLSFGIAPALLLNQWVLTQGTWGDLAPMGIVFGFLFVACGALRLARFNINANLNQVDKDFLGLPITIAGQGMATWVLFSEKWTAIELRTFLTLVLSFVLASLMVSTLRFPAYKTLKHNQGRLQLLFWFFCFGILSYFMNIRWMMAPFLLFSSYLGTSLMTQFFLMIRCWVF